MVESSVERISLHVFGSGISSHGVKLICLSAATGLGLSLMFVALWSEGEPGASNVYAVLQFGVLGAAAGLAVGGLTLWRRLPAARLGARVLATDMSSAMLDRLKIKSEFVEGLRVTDAATVEIVEMVLAGSVNKQIVTAIQAAGGRAVGLSGQDAALIEATKLTRSRRDPESHIEQVLDLGFVGQPTRIHKQVLEVFAGTEMVPVIAPIGLGTDGQTYNVNADNAAGAVAAALGADKLIMLTDVEGVLDSERRLISALSAGAARALLRDGTVSGGMIPKLETCVDAVEGGVEAAVILDGRVPHGLLLEIFTRHGVGTLVSQSGVED